MSIKRRKPKNRNYEMAKRVAEIVVVLCALGCGEGITSPSSTDIYLVNEVDDLSNQRGASGFDKLSRTHRSITPITYDFSPWCLRYSLMTAVGTSSLMNLHAEI